MRVLKSIIATLAPRSQSDRRQEPSVRDHDGRRGTSVHILLEWCKANDIYINPRLQIAAARGESDSDEASDDEGDGLGIDRGIAVYATDAVLESGTTRTRLPTFTALLYRISFATDILTVP